MTAEALDFRDECDQIAALLSAYDEDVFDRVTLFKSWTIGDVIAHLHLWNIAADLSLNAPEKFNDFITAAMQQLGTGVGHIGFQKHYFAEKSYAETFSDWKNSYSEIAQRFHKADPDHRVKWAGPDMSVRSCIIARQMEHWAHAQAVFDCLGVDRENHDRLKNVAHIGVTTFSWSFRVRGQTPPTPKPYVKLIAPSGNIWTWNDPQADNSVEGSGEEFCQVVTQCRNFADTDLRTTGNIAREWMTHAQCFAGGPEAPPPPGLRRKSDT